MRSSATLTAIKRRFRGREEAVEHAFEANESFRGLCRDYLACTAALVRWQEGELDEARLRRNEYSELLAELTAEIEACLDEDARRQTDAPARR
ncbi:MAG: hypothetical protein PVJ73_07030 [Acidobacteriota bacterium]|jgi:hypothetical protein